MEEENKIEYQEYSLGADYSLSSIIKVQLYDPYYKPIPCDLFLLTARCRFIPTIPGEYTLELLQPQGKITIKFSVKKDIVPDCDLLSYDDSDRRLFSLSTPVKPHNANHSFNGIMFNIKSKGPEDIEVLAFEVGGSLGPTRVYVSSSEWKTSSKPMAEDWSIVMSRHIVANKKITLVPLSIPVVILSKKKKRFLYSL